MAKVMDLRTGEYVAEYDLAPEEAVIAAFAQFERKDFNTWDYAKKYSVKHGDVSVSCGDYCAMTSSRSTRMADFARLANKARSVLG